MLNLNEIVTPGMVAQYLQEELALAHVQGLRRRHLKPDVEYRCWEGCLLLAGYLSKVGLVLYFPTVRISAEQAKRVTGRHGRGQQRFVDNPAGHHLTERAWVLKPSGQEESVGVACRHFWSGTSSLTVRDDALGPDTPTRRRASKPQDTA